MFAEPHRIRPLVSPVLALIITMGGVFLTLGATAQGAEPNLNWRPLSQLSPEQLAKVPSACCGAYIPPSLIEPIDATGVASETGWQINTDQFTGRLDSDFTADGNVTLSTGLQHIQAERITFDEQEQTAGIEGPITINEAGAVFFGTSARLNRETGAAAIQDANFVLYQSRTRGGAKLIDRDENQVMTLTNGEFTQCEPGQEDWIIKGSSIQIDPNTQKGTIRDMRLELGGVPVIYLPYWTFPAGDARQSGFLFPKITSKDFALPYYLNLAANIDMTLAPRIIKDRGTMVEWETRHLNRSFDTVLATAWLGKGKDGISDNEQQAIDKMELDPVVATEFDGQDRWLVGLQQRGGSLSEGPRQAQNLFGTTMPRWYSNIDYTKVSDYAYFRHIDTTNLNINRETHLRQQGDLGYQLADWRLNLHAEAYQSITLNAQEPYRQLPRVEIDGGYRWGNVLLELNNEITQFEHRQDFFNDNPADPRINGQRTRLDYALSWDKQWLWGFLKPGVAVKSIKYRLDPDTLAPNVDDQPGFAVPQTTLDAGLLFEREGSWFGSAYLQTFEPRVFYFYSDYQSHDGLFDLSPTNRDIDFDTAELTFGYNQLFRDSRFAGGDRIDDANQFSLGLTSRFLANASGLERLRLSLGQIFYNQDRRVTLTGNPSDNTALQSKSEIAGQIGAQLTDSWQLTGDGLFDPEQHQWNQRGLNLRYFDQQQRIVNLGYRYKRDPNSTPLDNRDQKQAELSLVLPIAGNWSVIAHDFHDFTNDEALDSMLGLEFTSCCYRIRVVGRRWIDNNLIEQVNNLELEHELGIFFELQLRGLGSVLDNISGVLSESIYNYQQRIENLQ